MSELYPTSENSNLPPGPQGPKGDTGVGLPGADGVDAFSILAAAFAQPGSSGDVTITINSSEWLAIGQNVYLENGGYYRVIALPSTTSAVLRNLGVSTNAAALSVIPAGSKLSAAGVSDTSFQTQLDLLDGRTDSLETAVLALQSAVIAGVDIANVGTGEGTLFAGVSGSTQRFRSLKANGGIAISVSGDDILLTATAGSFSVVHSGTGQTLIKDVVSGVTTLKGLTAGTGIGLTVSANGIQIENTLTLPTVSVDGLLSIAHVGNDYAVALFEADLPVADITGSGLITITPTGNSFNVGLAVADLPVQSVVAGSGVATVSNVSGTVTVAVPATTISHVAGTGTELLSSASGTNVVGKKLVAGSNITLSEDAGLITIAAAGGGGGGGSGDVSLRSTPLDLYVRTTGNDSTGDGSSGNPYKTLTRCFQEIQRYSWVAGTAVNIILPTGAYTPGVVQQLNYANGATVTIKGTTPPANTTLVSIQATSGSSRNYTLNLNVGSAANIAVGDFLRIRVTSGGTNPQYATGLFKVTARNVDGVATRISVNSLATGVPSGAVTSSAVEIIKSYLVAAAGDGISLSWTEALIMQDFVVDGNADTGNCLVLNQANLTLAGKFGTWRGLHGLYVGTGSTLSAGASSTGFAQGTSTGAAVLATHGSTIHLPQSVIVGGNTAAASLKGSFVDVYQSYIHSSVIGVYALFGDAFMEEVVISFCTTGISAWSQAGVSALGAVFISNTTNSSPAVNTVGNRNSFVATT